MPLVFELDPRVIEEFRRVDKRIREINERIEEMAASEDALNVALDQVATDLSAGIEAVQAELSQLAAANPGIDVAGALAKVQALDTTAKSLSTLAPTPDAPAPATGTVEGTVSTPAGTTPIDTSVTPDPSPAPAPADPAPAEPVEAAAPQPSKTVYTFAGDPSQVDPGAWPASGFETTEPTPQLLYYFSGDTAPGQANGNGLSGGQWVAYTGAVQAVAAAAS